MADALDCPGCGDSLPQRSRFCPNCGAALTESGTVEIAAGNPTAQTRTHLAQEPVEFPTTLHTVHRRPFGAPAAGVIGACAAAGLIAALVLFAVAAWVAGLLVLGLAIGAGTLFLSAVRQEADTPTALHARQAFVRTMARLRLAAVQLRTWTWAGLTVLRLRQRRRRLERRLGSQLRPLGEAVYRHDEQRAETLKAQAAVIEDAVKATAREEAATLNEAREQVARERATAQPTETFRT